jgi:hypothetical protein
MSVIPPSHMKERLSAAYISAVAARAAVRLYGQGDATEYGVDGFLQQIRRLPNGSYTHSGLPLQYQAKASTTAFFRNGNIVYDMEPKAYNKLVSVEVDDPPTIFILFLMPPDEEIDSWLILDEEQLTLRRCCYWDYITGSPTQKTSSLRIEIPIEQRFTPEALIDLFMKFKKGRL